MDTLAPFHDVPLDAALLEALVDEHESIRLPHLRRLWSYYRNALAEPTGDGGSRGAPAQWVGLPIRLTGTGDRPPSDARESREIVIENDVAWRVHTLVDFMFPAPPRLVSRAPRRERRREIETILDAVIAANGGAKLWQDAAVLGSVYGYVDFLLGTDALARRAGTHHGSPGAAPSSPFPSGAIDAIAAAITIETVEAPRAIPLVSRADYRALDAYVIHFEQLTHDVDRGGVLARLSRAVSPRRAPSARRSTVTVTEIHSAAHMQRYEDGRLVAEARNPLGRLPVVHVQNVSQPLLYEGLSDVEPLIPLQDELNTRLSDRANRVALQSFRMWLGKGIDSFAERPVAPGQMWVTDNPEASIEAFGGDAEAPSERAHIADLRDAMDRASGVTPAAAGHIKARVGNLTSENALRISLMGTIAKIKRKRVTYGAGIVELGALVLHALDVHGVYRTAPEERRLEVTWTDPLPVDESRRITDALAKAQLGIPPRVLQAELGYGDLETEGAPAARA